MSEKKQKIGNFGQKLAKEFLIRHGYTIIGEHFVIKGGEIDIIAKIGQEIVFVEVKTRTNQYYGAPEDAVDVYKLRALLRASEVYMHTHAIAGFLAYRLDIVGVLVNKNTKKVIIKHYKDLMIE